jgi:hypothetical protein
MVSVSGYAPTLRPAPPMRVQVHGPDSADVSAGDLKRLFRGRKLTPARRLRLSTSARVVAVCGSRPVGLAAYERGDTEIRVHEFGVDETSPCLTDDIVDALLGALETACLAGGGRRLVLLPRAAIASNVLRLRGYVTIAEGSAGSWLEKLLPS